MRYIVCAILLIAAWPNASFAQQVGTFSGNPQIELNPDGRTARVLKSLTFTDPAGLKWVVPKGAVVNGASIPRVFWTMIGGPWEGSYRDASIVHDYYCVRKNRSWQAVHRVFYDAMIARAVNPLKAKIMYYAVFKLGPRWKTSIVKVPGISFSGLPVMLERELTIDLPTPAYDSDVVEREISAIESSDLSLDQIDAMIDQAAGAANPNPALEAPSIK